MIVKDIYEDVRSVTNYADPILNFSRITDAVETLANKGNFDILLGYLTIAPQGGGNIITLPPDVETPIRVNIDSNPTFTRGRVYEFALNGPGQDEERVDWSWEDKGSVPVLFQPSAPRKLELVVTSALDNGKKITVYYRDANNLPKVYSFIMAQIGSGQTPDNVKSVDRVVKDETISTVELRDELGNILAIYQPNETEPQYRQIRISKNAGTAYIMFRRNRYAVTSMNDFIPIRSKMGLIYMVKAHQAYREDRFQDGQGFEQQAVTLAKEEQEQRHSYGAGQGGEMAGVLNLNIMNRDSVVVADIYDEASQIMGPVGRESIFDGITEGLDLLDGKANWDGKIGYVDILTDSTRQYLVLPRYVDSIIKMNINGEPRRMRSKWAEFHLNGPGQNWMPCGWQDEGEVVTLQITTYPQRFIAIPELPLDEDAAIRGFGLYNGKAIFTNDGVDGVPKEGFPIECKLSGAITSSQLVDDLQRIDKAESKGFIKLIGVDTLGNNPLVQGFWAPDETSPHYRKIKLSSAGATVRVMYRKNTIKVSSLTDPLHLKSRTAILCALRALDMLRKGQYDQSTAMEAKAVQIMSERNLIDNQSEVRDIEFLDDHDSGGYVDF